MPRDARAGERPRVARVHHHHRLLGTNHVEGVRDQHVGDPVGRIVLRGIDRKPVARVGSPDRSRRARRSRERSCRSGVSRSRKPFNALSSCSRFDVLEQLDLKSVARAQDLARPPVHPPPPFADSGSVCIVVVADDERVVATVVAGRLGRGCELRQRLGRRRRSPLTSTKRRSARLPLASIATIATGDARLPRVGNHRLEDIAIVGANLHGR